MYDSRRTHGIADGNAGGGTAVRGKRHALVDQTLAHFIQLVDHEYESDGMAVVGTLPAATVKRELASASFERDPVRG